VEIIAQSSAVFVLT